MFAASIEYICCSNVAICAVVCSRVCSCCFLRRKAALAAVLDVRTVHNNSIFLHLSHSIRATLVGLPAVANGRAVRGLTIFIGSNILPSYVFLLIHLGL